MELISLSPVISRIIRQYIDTLEYAVVLRISETRITVCDFNGKLTSQKQKGKYAWCFCIGN